MRHGETEWSLTGQHSGRVDLPLTPNGEREALETARALAGAKFDLVLCSPLRRSVRTCELCGLLPQARLEPDVMEWDYGDFNGLTRQQIRRTRPGWNIWDGPVPGGESIDQVAARAQRVLASAAACGHVAIFAHGHFLRVLVTQFLALDPRHGRCFALSTGSVSILGDDQGFPAILAWNRKGGSANLLS